MTFHTGEDLGEPAVCVVNMQAAPAHTTPLVPHCRELWLRLCQQSYMEMLARLTQKWAEQEDKISAELIQMQTTPSVSRSYYMSKETWTKESALHTRASLTALGGALGQRQSTVILRTTLP